MVQIGNPGNRPLVALRGKFIVPMAAPMHNPDHETAVDRVPPQNIALTVPVKVSGSDNLPIRSHRCNVGFGNDRGTIHKPDINLPSLRVTPKNVLLSVSIKITGITEEARRKGMYEGEVLNQGGNIRYAESGAQVEPRAGIIKSIRAVAARDDIAKVRFAALRIQYIDLGTKQPEWRQAASA